MKEYTLIGSIIDDMKRTIKETVEYKSLEVGDLLKINHQYGYTNVDVLGLLSVQIRNGHTYRYRGSNVFNIGPWSFTLYLGKRQYYCETCGHPIKPDEIRIQRRSYGIFGEVEQYACIYCVVK